MQTRANDLNRACVRFPSIFMTLAILLAPHSGWAQDKDEKQEKQADVKSKISRLIQKLGSESFNEREEAHKEIRKLGMQAVPALAKAMKETEEPEVRLRATKLWKDLTLSRRMGQSLKDIKGQDWQTVKSGLELLLGQIKKGPEREAIMKKIEKEDAADSNVLAALQSHLATIRKNDERMKKYLRLPARHLELIKGHLEKAMDAQERNFFIKCKELVAEMADKEKESD